MTSNEEKAGEEYKKLFDNAIEGIFRSSLDGHFIVVNLAMARIYGYESPEDMIASVRDISKQIYVDETQHQHFIHEITKHGVVNGFEAQNYRKDGSIIWTRTNAHIVKDKESKALFFEGFLADITHQKRAENALKESEGKYRALVERSPAIIFLDAVDDYEQAIYVSPNVETVFGYTPEEWCDQVYWSEIIHPEDRQRVLTESQRTDDSGEPFQIDYRLQKKDGAYAWVREEATLIKDKRGIPFSGKDSCWI